MSLRRSPRRSAAFLAANRANAQKSTGPRTAPGKQRSAANLRDFRGRSRPDRVELFAPPDPPELAWLDHPDDQGWMAGADDDLVRLRGGSDNAICAGCARSRAVAGRLEHEPPDLADDPDRRCRPQGNN